MEVYLQSLGMGIWKSVDDGYEFPKATTDESEETDEHTVSRTGQLTQKTGDNMNGMQERRMKYCVDFLMFNSLNLCNVLHQKRSRTN